jgi:hypothetical protein
MLFGSGFFVILVIALTVWAVVESFTADPATVRALPKTVWVIIILIFLPLGAAAWFVFGRPRKAAMSRLRQRGAEWANPGSAGPRRAASMAPDDDPEFLLRLRDQMRNKPDDDLPS